MFFHKPGIDISSAQQCLVYHSVVIEILVELYWSDACLDLNNTVGAEVIVSLKKGSKSGICKSEKTYDVTCF